MGQDIEFEALEGRARPSPAADHLDDLPQKVTLTSQILVATGICETRARQMLTPGVDKLPPSSFAFSFTADGVLYEEALLAEENRGVLVGLLNRGLGLHLPADTRVVPCEWKRDMAEAKDYINAQLAYALMQLRQATPGTPLIFSQMMLGIRSELEKVTLDCGRPDLLVWTGREWYVGDVKRAEAVSANHGVQVYYYANMARRSWAGLTPPLPGKLAAHGFVLHCAPGHAYTSRNSAEMNRACLSASVVETFPLSTLAPVYEQAYTSLKGLACGAQQPEQLFRKACVECLFRRGCYGAMLLENPQTHLSLLPLPIYEYRTLVQAGFTSVEDLLRADREHPVLLSIKDGRQDLVDNLRRKAAIVAALKGFSNWRSKEGWESKAAFFAVDRRRTLWFYDGAVQEAPPCPTAAPVDAIPPVIVAFSESEVRWCKRLLRRAGAASHELRDTEFVCLSDEVREQVHFPMVSDTLRATADFFRALAGGAEVRQIVRDWFAKFDARLLEEQEEAGSRLQALQDVWRGLLWLETQCHGGGK